MPNPNDQQKQPDAEPAPPYRGVPEMIVTAGAVIVAIDAPGFRANDLEWTVENRFLQLTERRFGRRFQLIIPLPVPVRAGLFLARCKNGLHEIRLERSERLNPSRDKTAGARPTPRT